LSLYTACAVENSRPSNPPREAAGHERMAPGWLRREHGRRVRPGTSTAALKAPNSPLVTDRQRPTWATWLMIRVFDSWLPALDLDESVVAIGAPGLAGGVEVGDRGRVQTRDDIGLERPEGSGGAGEVRCHVCKSRDGRPVAVADESPVVEVSFEDGHRCLLELGCEVGGHAVVRPGVAVELVRVEGHVALGHGLGGRG